jgi:hypothetical protein
LCSVGWGQEEDEARWCFIIIQLVIWRFDGLTIQGLKIWFPCTDEVSVSCTATSWQYGQNWCQRTCSAYLPVVAIVTAVFRSNEIRQSFISFPLEEYINVTRWGVSADFHFLRKRKSNERMCREQRKICYCDVRSLSGSFTSVCGYRKTCLFF